MLDAGRRHLAWLRRERLEVPDRLAHAFAYLGRIADAWPVPDPAPALERCQRAQDVVEYHRVAGKSLRERRARYPLACVWPPGADRFDGGR
ncbi:MAG TPA: hypothetical protein VFS43_16125 [Polyangiaceae bacterium]|nr:hypothetical protein [Polyangiaceae bacterium]